MLTFCEHVKQICTPKGLQRLSRASEFVFSSINRPAIGIGKQAVPRCLHPECIFPSQDVNVCVQCVHMSCLSFFNQSSRSSQENDTEGCKPLDVKSSHLYSHHKSSGHSLYLSVEYGQLYCVECDDFVFNRFVEGAIALQSYMARAHRRRLTSSVSPLDPMVQDETIDEHSLNIHRLKKRRLLTKDYWTPSDEELHEISQHSVLFNIPKSGVRPPVGLFNLGNSCYMNSVLQAFLNAPPLRNYFLADEHRHNCQKENKTECLACAIDRLMCDSCFTSENIPSREKGNSVPTLKVPFIVPQAVLDIIWRNYENLATYAQHDAHEFLIAALNLLNTHCRTESLERIMKKKTEPVLSDIKCKKGGQKPHRISPDSKRDFNPVSPVTNVRADPGGNFSSSDVLSRQSSTSIVQTLFSGTLQSDVICRACGNSSPTLEKFYAISLDVDKVIKPASTRRSRAQSPAQEGFMLECDVGNGSGSRALLLSSSERVRRELKMSAADSHLNSDSFKARMEIASGSWDQDGEKDLDSANTLHECLSRFTEPELLEASSKMHCVTCGMRQEAMKQMSIRTLPPIICFHFKRFEQSFASVRRSEMVKIDTPVEFPTCTLDLSHFQTSEVLRRRHNTETRSDATTVETALTAAMQQKFRNGDKHTAGQTNFAIRDNKEGIYDLFAIVNHNGRIDSGHYTATVRKEGEWFRCDDEKVSKISEIDNIVRSEEAYLVFYVQRHPNVQY